jgi:hypothetical protein
MPFAPVSRERAAAVWADRKLTSDQVKSAVEDWVINHGSTINLLWADLGAGKTHTLYYLESLCAGEPRLRPVYVLLPAAIKKFVQLYSAISDTLNWNEVYASLPLRPSSRPGRNLRKALEWVHSTGDVRHRSLAERWLHGDRLTDRQCDELGVTGWIDDTEDAVEVLRLAVGALSVGSRRVVLMIDEYQRVAEGSRRQLQEIGHAIHTLYNACPRDFTLLLSCAMGSYQDYSMVLTPEIRSRLSLFRVELPYLSLSDIKDYVADSFAKYRKDVRERNPLPYEPFTESAVVVLGTYLLEVLDGGVTPRAANQLFSLALMQIKASDAREIEDIETKRWLDAKGGDLIRQLREMT